MNDDHDLEPMGLSPLVRSISVKGLHGKSDYQLDLRPSEGRGHVSLIYGDNGSGKTTLLRLVWDLLSTAPNSGHRTRISKVAFESLRVQLTDGMEVRAARKVATDGSYSIELRKGNQVLGRSKWPDSTPYEKFFRQMPRDEWVYPDYQEDPDLRRGYEEAVAKRDFLELLESYGGAPFFLADNRTTASDQFDSETDYSGREYVASVRVARGEKPRGFTNPVAEELERTIQLVSAKYRRQSLGASVEGSAGANSVYLEVIRRLATTSSGGKVDEGRREDLIARLEMVGRRNALFAGLDLLPVFNTDAFVASVIAAHESRIAVVESVIDPFLQSLDARLDALDSPRSQIQTLLDEANRYLVGKRLVYRRRSFRIESDSGQGLDPDQLSSGESHLLLLLFTAVLARDSSRLFIIDEPELSLNVKWQRRIVESLLSLSHGTSLQFVMATHSIELLSGYRDRVVRLEPLDR